MAKLTDRFVSAFAPAPGAKDRLVFDTECKGLGLRATASGSKVFVVQWTDAATGRKVREPLGPWGALTIEEARKAARVRLGRVAAGFDPKAEREARRAEDARRRAEAARAKAEAAFTLDTLIEDWARLHLAQRRPRYAAEATRALRLAFEAERQKPASALTHEMVTRVLDRLATAGKAATARLTMAYGRACYGWAVKRRRVTLNPFAGLPAIEGGSTARDRVLTDDEIGDVWRAAEALAAPHGVMIRFALLTLARRDEVASMTWGEVAPDLSTWTQPGERTKNGKPHVVHLSKPARALLRRMLGVSDDDPVPVLPAATRRVFGLAENRPITAHSFVKRRLDTTIAEQRAKRAEASGTEPEPMPPWVLHDFRRSGVTWLAGAGFAPHVADRLLNHVSGTISGVAAIYQRGEFLAERKAALEAWGAHVERCAKGTTDADNLVPLRRRRNG